MISDHKSTFPTDFFLKKHNIFYNLFYVFKINVCTSFFVKLGKYVSNLLGFFPEQVKFSQS